MAPGRPEREPLDRTLQPERARPQVHGARGASERISEVTNHLVRIHLSPAPSGMGTHPPDPFDEIGAITRIPVVAHPLASQDEGRDSSIDARSHTPPSPNDASTRDLGFEAEYRDRRSGGRRRRRCEGVSHQATALVAPRL